MNSQISFTACSLNPPVQTILWTVVLVFAGAALDLPPLKPIQNLS